MLLNKYQWGFAIVWTLATVIGNLEYLAQSGTGVVFGFIIGAGGTALVAVFLAGIPVKWGYRKVQERRA